MNHNGSQQSDVGRAKRGWPLSGVCCNGLSWECHEVRQAAAGERWAQTQNTANAVDAVRDVIGLRTCAPKHDCMIKSAPSR